MIDIGLTVLFRETPHLIEDRNIGLITNKPASTKPSEQCEPICSVLEDSSLGALQSGTRNMGKPP